jgi:hypothetical protein
MICIPVFISCHTPNKNRISTERMAVSQSDTSSAPAGLLPIATDTSPATSSIKDSDAIELIKEFYHIYATTDAHTLNGLEKYVTKNVIDKDYRVALETEGGLAIRSQEYTPNDLKTLKVDPLGKNWYLVHYIQGTETDGFEYRIPMRVTTINGECKIDYITPSWLGEQYGDSLVCDHPKYPAIDNSGTLAFIRSFYSLYTLNYCSMPANLSERLSHLRANYLTPSAIAEYKSEEQEWNADEHPGYDLLIAGFDFEYSWYSSLRITRLSEYSFRVTIHKFGQESLLSITLVRHGDGYQISNIKRVRA